jgi:hypothetical protein
MDAPKMTPEQAKNAMTMLQEFNKNAPLIKRLEFINNELERTHATLRIQIQKDTPEHWSEKEHLEKLRTMFFEALEDLKK